MGRFWVLSGALVACLGCAGIEKAFHKHVRLNVTATSESRTLESGFEAEIGTRFVLVTLHIDNRTSESFAARASLFSLLSATGHTFGGSDTSNALDDGCRPDTQVDAHTEVDCTVLFEVPWEDAPEKISLLTPEARTGSAEVTLTPCEWQGDLCVPTSGNPDDCAGCGPDTAPGAESGDSAE